MNSAVKPITLTIMDKDYVVGCTEEERDELFASVDFLNHKLKEQRDSGKVIGNERVAVMAALNIAHELLENRRQLESTTAGLGDGLGRIQQKIEAALTRSGAPAVNPSASGTN